MALCPFLLRKIEAIGTLSLDSTTTATILNPHPHLALSPITLVPPSTEAVLFLLQLKTSPS